MESADGEEQKTMRRGPVAPALLRHLHVGIRGTDKWRRRWAGTRLCVCVCLHTCKRHTHTQFRLTASMPDSCIPMLTTAMVMTCQRTQRSVSSPQTDTDWMDDRERCSSCISSTSAWMFSFLRYHFRAEQAQESHQSHVNIFSRFNTLGSVRNSHKSTKGQLCHLQWWHGCFPSLSTGTADSLEAMATGSAGSPWETRPGTRAEASILPAGEGKTFSKAPLM